MNDINYNPTTELQNEVAKKKKDIEEIRIRNRLQEENKRLDLQMKQLQKKPFMSFDKSKLKFYLIAFTVSIFGAIVLFKILSKFI